MTNQTFINKEAILIYLKDYTELKETEAHDWSAVDFRLDLKKALTATVLTPDQRVAVALIYGLGLTFVQARKYIDMKVSELKETLDDALEAIEAVINGYKTDYHAMPPTQTDNLLDWLAGVSEGAVMPLDVPDKVVGSLLDSLAARDPLAKEALKYHQMDTEELAAYVLGIKDSFNIFGKDPYDVENYPSHDTSHAVEDPNRSNSTDFVNSKIHGYDFFRDQDRHHDVGEFIDEEYSRSLRSVGKKATKSKSSDNNNGGSGKGVIYAY